MGSTISPLPPAPSRGDDAQDFADKADAFVAAMDPFGTETNVVASEVEANAASAEADALTASDAELAAVSAANYIGPWSTLSGALNIPASVENSGIIWVLKYNIPDVAAAEPTYLNPDWVNATLSEYTGSKNKIINGNFGINQRSVAGTVILLAGEYGHDRFKAGAGGCTYTFSTLENITTITISAGSLIQVISGVNLQSATYSLSWAGTAQGKIGAGGYSNSGVTGSVTGGTNLNIEFNTGTLSIVQFERGPVSTPFEERLNSGELVLCQSYYEVSFPHRVRATGISPLINTVLFKERKVGIPTIILTGATISTVDATITIDGFSQVWNIAGSFDEIVGYIADAEL